MSKSIGSVIAPEDDLHFVRRTHAERHSSLCGLRASWTSTLHHSLIWSSGALQARVKTSNKNHDATKGHQDHQSLWCQHFVQEGSREVWDPHLMVTLCAANDELWELCFIHSFNVSFAASPNYFNANITSASGIMASNSSPAKTLQSTGDTRIDQSRRRFQTLG